MGFGVGLGAKWKARQSGKQNSAINLNAIHGGEDLVDFGGGTLVVGDERPARLSAHIRSTAGVTINGSATLNNYFIQRGYHFA